MPRGVRGPARLDLSRRGSPPPSFALAGSLGAPESRFRLVALVGVIVGALFGGAALARSFLVAWLVLLGIGIGIGVIIVNLMTELQVRSPEGERGGIMGAAEAIGGTSFPVGMALTGILLDVMSRQGITHGTSTRTILAISAVACVLVALAAVQSSRRPDDHRRPPTRPHVAQEAQQEEVGSGPPARKP